MWLAISTNQVLFAAGEDGVTFITLVPRLSRDGNLQTCNPSNRDMNVGVKSALTNCYHLSSDLLQIHRLSLELLRQLSHHTIPMHKPVVL